MKIPKCMSTQHPDNALSPFFSREFILEGEDEVKEAYYVFSHLGCDEQMWDYEGKEVDNRVVAKLIMGYEQFFKDNILGRDFFLTLRVPNPTIEKEDSKILLETLESIPRSYDVAKTFHSKDIAPIFEVILPMTTSSRELNRIHKYYKDYVVGKKKIRLFKEDITISEWIGEFRPEHINVIPLIEDYEHMLKADKIVDEYISDKDINYKRVFLARSDPALNYGSLSAVLINKIALKNLHILEGKTGKTIYPIIGVGSAPFRGNFKPTNFERCLEEYPSVQTFTVQSAFKYDYPVDTVREAIKKINVRERGNPTYVDEKRCLEIIKKSTKEYETHIKKLVPIINKISEHIPKRRKRKLHIGLFGYSRNIGKVRLPRAIGFCASLYSLGIPPELFGTYCLNKDDLNFLKVVYKNFENDIRDSLTYINEENLVSLLGKSALRIIDRYDVIVDKEHNKITKWIMNNVREGKDENLEDLITEAAYLRKFLG